MTNQRKFSLNPGIEKYYDLLKFVDEKNNKRLKEDIINTIRAHYMTKINDKIDHARNIRRRRLRTRRDLDIYRANKIARIKKGEKLTTQEKKKIYDRIHKTYIKIPLIDYIELPDMPEAIKKCLIDYYNFIGYEVVNNCIVIIYTLELARLED